MVHSHEVERLFNQPVQMKNYSHLNDLPLKAFNSLGCVS
jgi:hypothetical protein